MLALQELTPEALARAASVSLEEARKVVSRVHRDLPVDGPVEQVRKESLARIRALCHLPQVEVRAVQQSAVDPFVKVAVGLAGGAVVEAVRIPLERPGRFSVCVSSQVGCALACAFCATGRLGLTRNLEAWEIVEQVRVVRRTLCPSAGQRVHGVVFQGMGEPLSNLDRVLQALSVLTDPSALAIDARNITVCTAGLPAGIRRLAREAPKVRLGLSLGGARGEVRRRLMPIDRAHDLDDVLDAAVEHARVTGLGPLWAVTLLSGVNDGDDDARALARRAAAFAAQAGVRPRISIIPYNAIADEGDPFARTSDEVEQRFRAVLLAEGFGTHRRYSGGADVAAACGQLAARSAVAGRPTPC